MFKSITVALLLAACASAGAEPKASIEFKLTAGRDRYVVNPPRVGPARPGHVPAVVLEAELRNTGPVALRVVGSPEPELALTAPKDGNVHKAGGRFFYAPQTEDFTLGPGEVKRLPLRSLRFRVGAEQWALSWKEPGDYKLTATWTLKTTPAVAGAGPGAAETVVTLAAAPVLLKVRSGDEVAYWAEALSDPVEEVRLTAALALKERARDAAPAVERLAAALADGSPAVRRTAAEALQRASPAAEAAAPALRRARTDREDTVRAAAADALAEVAPKDPDSGRAVLALLRDRSEAVRRAGARALGRMANRGLPPDRATVEALRGAFKDGDQTTRQTVIWAFGHVRHPDSVLDLIGLLRPECREFHHQVLHSIGTIGSVAAGAVPELIVVLRNDPEHREMAAWALGSMGSRAAAAVPALTECLDDERAAVRNQAARALRDVGPEAAGAVDALAGVMIVDKEWGVRQYAAEALGAIGPAAGGVAKQLGEALRDPMVQVRTAAVKALGDIGPKAGEGLPSLRAVLRGDPDGQVRWLAAQAIGRIGVAHEPTVAALARALSDRDATVVSTSAIALGRLGLAAAAAAPALTKLAGADCADPFSRRSAREALEKVRPK